MKPKQFNAMTNLKPKNQKTDVAETYFCDIKNELLPIETAFIKTAWNREFHWHNECDSILESQTLDVILKLLQNQSGNLNTGAGEIVNSVLIARIKSFILKNKYK